VSRALDVATSTMASVLRLGAGWKARPAARQPEKLLELYEFEACPYCRRVREAMSELDLDAMIYPCPRGGTRFRPKAIALSGKRRFPFLVDANTGRSMNESGDIVEYLRQTYGGAGVPIWLGPLSAASSSVAAAMRGLHGRAARPSRSPEHPLELWSFEASPYSRLVREALCELELPYVLHNVAVGSPRRAAFVARSGRSRVMVPYLVDPNAAEGEAARTGMFESADIVRHLQSYAAGANGAR
jgi:glutathione S-transferase